MQDIVKLTSVSANRLSNHPLLSSREVILDCASSNCSFCFSNSEVFAFNKKGRMYSKTQTCQSKLLSLDLITDLWFYGPFNSISDITSQWKYMYYTGRLCAKEYSSSGI